jgi:hypothetical protein
MGVEGESSGGACGCQPTEGRRSNNRYKSNKRNSTDSAEKRGGKHPTSSLALRTENGICGSGGGASCIAAFIQG